MGISTGHLVAIEIEENYQVYDYTYDYFLPPIKQRVNYYNLNN